MILVTPCRTIPGRSDGGQELRSGSAGWAGGPQEVFGLPAKAGVPAETPLGTKSCQDIVPSGSLWKISGKGVQGGLYSPWNSLGQNTGVGSLSLLQGIFPTQESNQDLLHCRLILYQLSYQESLWAGLELKDTPCQEQKTEGFITSGKSGELRGSFPKLCFPEKLRKF